MTQYSMNIGEIIKEVLDKHNPSIPFETIWRKKQEKKNRDFKFRKVYSVPIIAIIIFLSMFTVGFASYQIARKVDQVDYQFVNDTRVYGKWKSVDFVKCIEDFNPEVRYWKGELYLNELVFIKGGKMLNSINNGNLAYAPTTWTKERIINEQEKTTSGYDIKEINGKTFLFMQWKNGDYIFMGAEPNYYVLERVDSKDYSDYKVTAIQDKIDYPFENDIEMIGKWQSVDFVRDISKFKPGSKYWLDDLYLTQFDISDNGKIAITTTKGKYRGNGISWTKGLIIDRNNKTASQCTIKEIDGNTYMFYEWKSGDYIYRGVKPSYYVFRKAK